MKKIAFFLLCFGICFGLTACNQNKSIAYELVGTYVYEGYQFALYEPENSDELSGKLEVTIGNHVYYGTYDIYEEANTVLMSFDQGFIKETTWEGTYDLDNQSILINKGIVSGETFEKQ